ncbi:hypothetical protein FJY71_06515 [candidate division WOR-3 bacterium]|nr:hypothetical protein [candidate division WOR-3 bacterium]
MSGRLSLVMLACCLLGAGCGDERRPEPVLVTPEWQDGEVSEYDIVRRDTVVFRRRVLLEFDEESAVPLVVVTSTVVPEEARIYLADSMAFALRRFSLKPEWSYRLVTTDVSISEVFARWDEGGVDIRKETVEGGDERRLKVAVGCFSAEMMQTVLRGMPLEPGSESRTRVLIPLEFRVTPVRVSVLGTKLVSTPLGDILCREVEVAERDRHLRLLYELDQPHRLVEVRDPDTRTQTLLVRYVPGRPDTVAPDVLLPPRPEPEGPP